jgi:hypothetical protein
VIAVAATVVPISTPVSAAGKGKIVLAWHAGFASRWLDPQEHDGTATPDNFFTAIHDALIKNQGTELYDHLALAEKFTIAPDSKSATFTLRKGTQVPQRRPGHPQDVKFSYENYRGAKADVFKKKTERVEIVDDRTIRFVFKEPFLDFAILFGTANVAGPAGSCREVLQAGGRGRFKQKPIGAGPYKLVATSRREGRDGGLRRVLPPRAREAARHGLGAGSGHARRHAGARRGGHRLQRPRRADRQGRQASRASRWRRCCPGRSSSSSPISRTRRTRSATSACARR